MKLLIKFPTRGRPEKFLKTLDIYRNLSVNKNDIVFLITLDEDDSSVTENLLSYLKSLKDVVVDLGTSDSKIHAVNRGIENINFNWDILLLASDDMIPQIWGYDNIIFNDMKFNFPDTDGVLWYNDGYQKDKLNTLCILGREYYKRFGYIYHPQYKSTWCDNEFTEVSKILRKVLYFDKIIIKHEHPDWGFGNRDQIHQKNFKDLNHDMNLYKRRNLINFDI